MEYEPLESGAEVSVRRQVGDFSTPRSEGEPQKVIPAAIDRIERALSHAEEKLDRLGQRITPVLHTDITASAVREEIPKSSVPLAGHLHEFANRIESLAQVADELGDRVGL